MFHLRNILRTGNKHLFSSKHLCKNFNDYFIKCSRCSSISTDYEIKFKPHLSSEEHEKILNVLNSSSVEDLKR